MVLAWRVQSSTEKVTKIPLFSYILILAAMNHFNTGKIVLNGFGFANQNAEIINLCDLALLPICLLIVATITNRSFKAIKLLNLVCLGIPTTTVLFLVVLGRLGENPHWIMSAIYTILAILLFKVKIKANFLTKLSYFGSISYAFYLLHVPVMHLISNYFPLGSSGLNFAIRFLIWLLLTIGISSYLELVLQPKIKSWSKQNLLLKTD